MPSRPDIRDLASNVREAFADSDKEQLLDILTFVLKEYVVEGPPPMLVHQAETLADLKNTSFAGLITAMQTRFDFPELQTFVVDGEQVSVRIGGVVQPLLAPRPGERGAGAAEAPPTAPAARAPQPAPGVRTVEMPTQPAPRTPGPIGQALAAAATERSGNERPATPPPVRGLSLRGRPAGGGGGGDAPDAPAPTPGAPAAPSAPAAAAPAAAAPEPKKDSGDDASARFSLLELDLSAIARRYYERGRAQLETQEYESAQEALRAALDLAPNFGNARVAYAIALAKGGDCPRGAQVLRVGIPRASSPISAAAMHATLGDVLTLGGDLFGAEEAFRQASHCPGFEARAASGLARVYAKLGRFGDMAAALKRAAAPVVAAAAAPVVGAAAAAPAASDAPDMPE